jgi:hypothetical protein
MKPNKTKIYKILPVLAIALALIAGLVGFGKAQSTIIASGSFVVPITCSLTANNINFGTVQTGSASNPQSLIITNTGNTVTDAWVSGSDWSAASGTVGWTAWSTSANGVYTSLTTSPVNTDVAIQPSLTANVYFEVTPQITDSLATQTISIVSQC